MKTKMLLIITITLLGQIISSNDKSYMNKEGSYSNMNTDSIEAVSYALAKEKKTDDFYVQNSKDYKNPLVVEKLPPKMPSLGGEITTVEEIPSPEDYYDGSKGLKTTYTVCQQYTTQQEVCLHQGSCGWCGSSNSCISGNNIGPLAPCLRGSYKFTAPQADWNPLNTNDYSVSRANVGGAQLTTMITK